MQILLRCDYQSVTFSAGPLYLNTSPTSLGLSFSFLNVYLLDSRFVILHCGETLTLVSCTIVLSLTLFCWLTSLTLQQLCSSLFFLLIFQTQTVAVLSPVCLSGCCYVNSSRLELSNTPGFSVELLSGHKFPRLNDITMAYQSHQFGSVKTWEALMMTG